eukprot:8351439-Ditylum_brightwellii.AAC.1
MAQHFLEQWKDNIVIISPLQQMVIRLINPLLLINLVCAQGQYAVYGSKDKIHEVNFYAHFGECPFKAIPIIVHCFKFIKAVIVNWSTNNPETKDVVDEAAKQKEIVCKGQKDDNFSDALKDRGIGGSQWCTHCSALLLQPVECHKLVFDIIRVAK